MGTKLNSNQGRELCELLRKYNEGEWWFDSAAQQFNKHDEGKISSAVLSASEVLNFMFNLFQRMDIERETVSNMLPHYDPKHEIWMAYESEVQAAFDYVYPGCAEPLQKGEISGIIDKYKKGVEACLDDWEGILRDAIEDVAPRIINVESTIISGRILCQRD